MGYLLQAVVCMPSSQGWVWLTLVYATVALSCTPLLHRCQGHLQKCFITTLLCCCSRVGRVYTHFRWVSFGMFMLWMMWHLWFSVSHISSDCCTYMHYLCLCTCAWCIHDWCVWCACVCGQMMHNLKLLQKTKRVEF